MGRQPSLLAGDETDDRLLLPEKPGSYLCLSPPPPFAPPGREAGGLGNMAVEPLAPSIAPAPPRWTVRLCCQLLEKKGGMFGCQLPAGHESGHTLPRRRDALTASTTGDSLHTAPVAKRRPLLASKQQPNDAAVLGDDSSVSVDTPLRPFPQGLLTTASTPAIGDDCGTCAHCLDKPEFGGRGIKRKSCMVAKHTSIVGRESDIASTCDHGSTSREGATEPGADAPLEAALLVDSAGAETVGEATGTAPTPVATVACCTTRLCCQLLEKKGGMFGCQLPAGHKGGHTLPGRRGASLPTMLSDVHTAPVVKRRVLQVLQVYTPSDAACTDAAAREVAAEVDAGALPGPTQAAMLVDSAGAETMGEAKGTAPTPVGTVACCTTRLCCQLLEKKGGMFGCQLPAGHEGGHTLPGRRDAMTANPTAVPAAAAEPPQVRRVAHP